MVEASETAVALSAIAAHPHGDTGSARDFCLDLVFAALAEVEKGLHFLQQPLGAQSFSHASPGQRNFQHSGRPAESLATGTVRRQLSLLPGFSDFPLASPGHATLVHVPVRPQAAHAGGLSAETLRLPFRQPRGPFLDRPDPGEVDALDYFCFQVLELGRRVLGGREEERLSREARRLHPVLPRGPFLVRRSGFASRLSCLPFSRARTAPPALWGR